MPAPPPVSVGESLMQKVVTVLNAPIGKPCTTVRSRTEAIALSEDAAFVLRADRETGQRLGAVSLRTRKVWLDAIVRGAAPADAAVDPLYIYAVQTLCASTELMGMLRNLDQAEIVWDLASSTDDVAVAGISFELIFPIFVADPTAAYGGH